MSQFPQSSDALAQVIQTLGERSLEGAIVLQELAEEIRRWVNADRGVLWIVDRAQHDLWTTIPYVDGQSLEVRIPMEGGIAGEVALTGQSLFIPFDLYDHPVAEILKTADRRNGYRTCSMLCLPIWDAHQQVVGVMQLINKQSSEEPVAYAATTYPEAPIEWQVSFSAEDIDLVQTLNRLAALTLQEMAQGQTEKRAWGQLWQTIADR